MAYVYKYIDKADNQVKYVGIVYGVTRSLTQRIVEHTKDSWYQTSDEWEIWYLDEDINSRTDAEYFESHYISLYGSDKFFNRTKAGWGISKYLPDRESEWKKYDESLIEPMVRSAPVPVEKSLLEWLDNSDCSIRKKVFQDYNSNARGFSRKDKFNEALSNMFGFNPDGYWSGEATVSISYDDENIQVSIPTLDDQHTVYTIKSDGSWCRNRFSSNDFVKHAREYIERTASSIDKIEKMLSELQEKSHYFTT